MERDSPAPGLGPPFEAIERARGLLESPRPEVLEETARLFEQAWRDIEEQRADLTADRKNKDVLRLVKDLRNHVARSRILLESAFDFHQQWAVRKGSLIAGYDCGGRAAEYVASGHMSMRG